MIDSIPLWPAVLAWSFLIVLKIRDMHAGNKEVS